ncbi:unnamed protein product [Hermetia illucens]|uniref:MIF4G domain-containing protein n=2 Tax=Hermetia illucens TaxID=343691 RepID=A0A7R8UXZ8_HERIL|nr:polyadenylate-binding protein-interacting protein 1 isoform X1 [Hermetia illucens]CAD7089052.1 unnamed protein product [Hermetia illucens]
MDNPGRAIWDRDMEYSDMRKPHGRGGGGGGGAQTSNHTLSPDAKEFIPRSKPQTDAQMPQQLPHQNHGGQYADYRNSPQAPSHRGSGLHDRLLMQQFPNNGAHHQHQQYEYSRSNASSNSHHHHSNHHSVQNRLKNTNNQNYQNSTNNANSESSQANQMQTDEESVALTYITEAVKFLNEDPGLFDSLESHLCKAFAKFGDSEFILSNAMEIIFVQSIEEQNFRYMGAKLYRLLDLINPQPSSVFRRLLNCKLTYHQEEVLNYMTHEQAKVRATTLFLAELYMQLKSETFRIKEIAHNIIYTINQLLRTSSPENIKCICLTLKLCGYELEMDFPDDVREIMAKLNQKVNNVDVGTSRILETVLLLQKNNWGHTEAANQSSPVNESPASYSGLPVFYGPDGEVMTEEENSFLQSHIPHDVDTENDCDDCDILDPDLEMDPEIESAYEDFLKQKPKHINKSC